MSKDKIKKAQRNENFKDAEILRLETALALSATLVAERNAEIDNLRVEVEAYKKAKAENDERYMTERDTARAEVEQLKAQLAQVLDAPCESEAAA